MISAAHECHVTTALHDLMRATGRVKRAQHCRGGVAAKLRCVQTAMMMHNLQASTNVS